MSGIQNEDLPVLTHLIDVLCADVNAVTTNGYTPLILAAYKGQDLAVKQLIGKGADVNTVTNDGYTPLIYAAFNGHSKIVKQLIENGADVNATNEYGANAIIYAAHKVMYVVNFSKF